jgi:hypothetical protein
MNSVRHVTSRTSMNRKWNIWKTKLMSLKQMARTKISDMGHINEFKKGY